jgi:hypothetical protein
VKEIKGLEERNCLNVKKRKEEGESYDNGEEK